LRLIVRNKISFANPLPVSYEEKIKSVPGVREVMIQQWFGGTYKDERDPANNFARFAIEPTKLFRLHPEYEMPAWQVKHFLNRPDSCIIGRALADRLELKLGDRITLTGDIFPVRLNLLVAGIYESAIDNEVLYFHNEYLNESLRKHQDYAIMLMVMVDDADAVVPVSRRIDNLFHNASVQTKTETEKTFRLNFLSYIGNIKLFLFAVCASFAGTVLLVSVNSIAISVRERAQEIGVMKALGFSADTVLSLIALESMLMGAMGGLLGLCAAQVLIAAVRNLPVVMVSLSTLSLSPAISGLALLVAAVCGVISAVPPAWRASRRSITECLAQAD
jgi:putative ABC transport system permease protein